ncbi:quinol monooxygenase YgiN [Actinocorallia herbida]|uniref:Quinol monooxygenase YgiN n=1 Tax=Actinocorallia herbida TaxID=58109 RepID=A0A3N1CVL4_9ACTN|nr:putative quinol monooxygenase [Actinocorallia herbida]ROO84748.1 quinol monooxygenase YgiN [Actinocorallia herbida]
MPYAVIAHYRCAESDADLIRAELAQMASRTPTEPGNLAYIVHTDATAGPGEAAFTLYEQYVDEAAFAAHAETPHFKRHIIETVRPLLTDRTVWFGTTL